MSSNRLKILQSLIRELRADFVSGWIPIAQSTLTGSVASVTFSSIPGDFRNLVFMTQARSDRIAESDTIIWQANSDSGANYDRTYGYFQGNNNAIGGGLIGQTAGYLGECEGGNSRASNFAPTVCFFLGYKETDREKYSINLSALFGDVSATSDLFLLIYSGRWRNTAAITSLKLLPVIGNFVSGSIFQLYGIL